jgi:hypothetical protein
MRVATVVFRLVLLVAVFSSFARAQVVVTDDANTSSFSPKSNYGTSIALIVCSGSNTYLKFSLANLGPGITSSNVSKAPLVLYVDYVLTPGTMDVYQVSGSWSEGSITYNTAPALGTKLFSAVSVTKTGFLSLDLTSSVQAWLSGTLVNNGIALVPTTGSAISASFDSKENIFTSHPADLDLVLISAGPQGQQGMQGPQGTVGPQGPTGPAGPTGPTGPTGATGPAGQQGLPGLMGLTGLTGVTGPAGANGTGFNFRNEFDNSASYVANDVVTYKGSSYVATVASAGPSNPTPDSNTTAWTIMAAQGAQGAAGAQGPAGSAGATGAPGLAGAQGPAGATGPAGPIGQTGPPGSGGGGFSGIQEFTQSGTFTVPAGVTRLLVEMWGAGGGGGGGFVGGEGCSPNPFGGCYTYNIPGNQGHGGGGGSYTRTIIAVTPGSTYSVVMGTGGAGGAGDTGTGPADGGVGGTTEILDPSSSVLASAVGGGSPSGGVGVSGPNVIVRNGNPASASSGGVPAAGSIPLPGSAGKGGAGGYGGAGFDNGSGNPPGGQGQQGNPGYALITF